MKNRGIFKGILGLSLLVVASNNLFVNDIKALELDDTATNAKNVEQVIDNKLSREELFNSVSINMEFSETDVVIRGNIDEFTTVEDILNNIFLDDLQDTMLIEKVGIVSEIGDWLGDSDIVDNSCYIIFISNEFIAKYQISFWGDFDGDATITEEDVKVGIDNYLEQNTENDVIPEDVSGVSAVVNNNTYEVEEPLEEDVNVSLKRTEDKDIYIEDSFKVQLKINGFINNYFNVISGILRYDNNILKLESFYIVNNDKVIMGDIKDNRFIYLLDNYSDNDVLLIMTFKVVGGGDANIYIDDLKLLMNGFMLNADNNDFRLKIMSNLYGKGGNYELDNSFDGVLENVVNNVGKKENVVVINNSNNNYRASEDNKDSFIKRIEIDNYNINFDKDIKFYTIDIENDIDSLDINIELSDDMASYAITGNENFKVGKNNIIITLLSKDGSSTDYVIEVNKKLPKIDKNGEKDGLVSKNNMMFVPIITLIILILLLLYKLIKEPA